jgi:hypothetical protein
MFKRTFDVGTFYFAILSQRGVPYKQIWFLQIGPTLQISINYFRVLKKDLKLSVSPVTIKNGSVHFKLPLLKEPSVVSKGSKFIATTFDFIDAWEKVQ